jgi:hypothetical protein
LGNGDGVLRGDAQVIEFARLDDVLSLAVFVTLNDLIFFDHAPGSLLPLSTAI